MNFLKRDFEQTTSNNDFFDISSKLSEIEKRKKQKTKHFNYWEDDE